VYNNLSIWIHSRKSPQFLTFNSSSGRDPEAEKIISDERTDSDSVSMTSLDSEDHESCRRNKSIKGSHVAIVITFSFFLFLYVGMEYCFGTYLTTFAVKSRLSATREEGAQVTAIFWGAFSLMRFLAIFASSLRVRPLSVLAASFALCAAGSGAAATGAAEASLSHLHMVSGVTGFGMGTIFATGLAWLEALLPLDNWLGTMLVR